VTFFDEKWSKIFDEKWSKIFDEKWSKIFDEKWSKLAKILIAILSPISCHLIAERQS
jgi:hypothetical protein